MKDLLKKAFGAAFGRTVASFAARIAIAVIMLVTGSSTDIGDAVGVALNKERSIAAAVELINETPSPEIKAAIAEEKSEETKEAVK